MFQRQSEEFREAVRRATVLSLREMENKLCQEEKVEEKEEKGDNKKKGATLLLSFGSSGGRQIRQGPSTSPNKQAEKVLI